MPATTETVRVIAVAGEARRGFCMKRAAPDRMCTPVRWPSQLGLHNCSHVMRALYLLYHRADITACLICDRHALHLVTLLLLLPLLTALAKRSVFVSFDRNICAHSVNSVNNGNNALF